MQLTDLLSMGAKLRQNNDDDSTTGLDASDITSALGGILGGGDGGLDLSSMLSKLSDNGLGSIVGSWLGDGENAPISIDQVKDLVGSDKISEFASKLGLSEESASKALADALPQVVDKATSGEDSMLDSLLEKVGGAEGAMGMLGKLFN